MTRASSAPRVLLLDSACSFARNLAHAFGELGADVTIERGGQRAASDILHPVSDGRRQPPFELVVVGPGPRKPSDLPALMRVVRGLSGRVPLFGVCLGHQVFAELWGTPIRRAAQPVHGTTVPIDHTARGLFRALSSPMHVMRYNSLAFSDVPRGFQATAHNAAGEVMAMENSRLLMWSVQFHPESIGTFGGLQLLANVLDLAGVTGQKLRERWTRRVGGVPSQAAYARLAPSPNGANVAPTTEPMR